MRLRMLVNGRALVARRVGYYIHTHMRTHARTRASWPRHENPPLGSLRDRRIKRHPLDLLEPHGASPITACNASGELGAEQSDQSEVQHAAQ